MVYLALRSCYDDREVFLECFVCASGVIQGYRFRQERQGEEEVRIMCGQKEAMGRR